MYYTVSINTIMMLHNWKVLVSGDRYEKFSFELLETRKAYYTTI